MEKLNLDDPMTKSADIIEGNIEVLRSIFPEVFSEGKLSVESLKQLVGEAIDDSEEKYGLNWHGKRKAKQVALTPSTGTLRPAKDDSIEWDSTENLMIEGDNLEVLKLLQKSYAKKIKVIYIDPPYNTGKDFVYPDDFRDNIKNYLELTGQTEGGQKLTANTEASGRFHTDWLNMIYPRLKLARNLLCDDGLIFISIDENEIGNLRLVCDEIFGEENFKGQITRATGTPTGQGTTRLVNELDYIVVYSRSPDTGFTGQSLTEDGEKIYDQEDERGRFLTRPLRKTGGEDRRADRPSMYFPVEAPDGSQVYPVGPGGYESRWRCGPETYKSNLTNGLIQWKEVKNSDGSKEWKVYQKFYLEGRLKQPGNLWTDLEGNKKASREVRELFGEKVFDFPKPIDLLRKICEIASDKDAIILDFFAGSGTTGQAVWELNSSDGGKRRFILVQLPEMLDPANKDQKAGADFCARFDKPFNIAELTKIRLSRASEKIRTANPMFTGDNGFRVFKLDSSNIRTWEPNKDDIAASLLDSTEHIKSGRTEDDILYELLIKLGLDLAVPIETKTIEGKQVHSIGAGALIACLPTSITREQVEPLAMGIIAWHREEAPSGEVTVVFRDSAFADDVAKTNMAAILSQHGLTTVRSL